MDACSMCGVARGVQHAPDVRHHTRVCALHMLNLATALHRSPRPLAQCTPPCFPLLLPACRPGAGAAGARAARHAVCAAGACRHQRRRHQPERRRQWALPRARGARLPAGDAGTGRLPGRAGAAASATAGQRGVCLPRRVATFCRALRLLQQAPFLPIPPLHPPSNWGRPVGPDSTLASCTAPPLPPQRLPACCLPACLATPAGAPGGARGAAGGAPLAGHLHSHGPHLVRAVRAACGGLPEVGRRGWAVLRWLPSGRQRLHPGAAFARKSCVSRCAL